LTARLFWLTRRFFSANPDLSSLPRHSGYRVVSLGGFGFAGSMSAKKSKATKGNLQTNTDVAYDFLRERILSGEYPPGSFLSAQGLSKQIGVSRTPVRDALRLLEIDGLVDFTAHLGAVVKSFTIRDFLDLCGVREALETYAAELAAESGSRDEMHQLEGVLGQMGELTDHYSGGTLPEEDFHAVMHQADWRLHSLILQMARNDLLINSIKRLENVRLVMTRPFSHIFRFSDPKAHLQKQVEHEAIVKAILKRDPVKAGLAMKAHHQNAVRNHHELWNSQERIG